MTHLCDSKLDHHWFSNGLSPGRHQAIIWTNTGILLIGRLGRNLSGILIETHIFSFNKMHLKMSSGNGGQFCLGLNVLKRFYHFEIKQMSWQHCGESPANFKATNDRPPGLTHCGLVAPYGVIKLSQYCFPNPCSSFFPMPIHQTGNVPVTFPECYNQVSSKHMLSYNVLLTFPERYSITSSYTGIIELRKMHLKSPILH